MSAFSAFYPSCFLTVVVQARSDSISVCSALILWHRCCTCPEPSCCGCCTQLEPLFTEFACHVFSDSIKERCFSGNSEWVCDKLGRTQLGIKYSLTFVGLTRRKNGKTRSVCVCSCVCVAVIKQIWSFPFCETLIQSNSPSQELSCPC